MFGAFVEKLDVAKIKVSKRSSKLTDKQTSGTNSSNIDVQVQKERIEKKETKPRPH